MKHMVQGSVGQLVRQSVSQVLYWRKADMPWQWHWKFDNTKTFINVNQFLCVKHIPPTKFTTN